MSRNLAASPPGRSGCASFAAARKAPITACGEASGARPRMARAWSAVSLGADIFARFCRNYAQRPVKARERRARSAIAAAKVKDAMPKKPIIPFSPSEADYLQQVADAET